MKIGTRSNDSGRPRHEYTGFRLAATTGLARQDLFNDARRLGEHAYGAAIRKEIEHVTATSDVTPRRIASGWATNQELLHP